MFSDGADVVTTLALSAGVYTVQSGDVTRQVIVNPSHELVPRAPVAVPQTRTAGEATMAPRALLERTWPIVLALVLLSVDWLLRRRVGLR
jgi:hypothetical protein